MQWTFGGVNGTNFGTGTSIVLDMFSAFRTTFGAGIRDVTVQRIIGEVTLREAGTAGSPGVVTFGMVVASLDAFAAGAASLPSPDGDAASWMYWWRGFTESLVGADIAGAINTRLERHIPFDVKGQRKLDAMRNTLVLIIKNVAGHNVIVGGNGRVLVLWNT